MLTKKTRLRNFVAKHTVRTARLTEFAVGLEAPKKALTVTFQVSNDQNGILPVRGDISEVEQVLVVAQVAKSVLG